MQHTQHRIPTIAVKCDILVPSAIKKNQDGARIDLVKFGPCGSRPASANPMTIAARARTFSQMNFAGSHLVLVRRCAQPLTPVSFSKLTRMAAIWKNYEMVSKSCRTEREGTTGSDRLTPHWPPVQHCSRLSLSCHSIHSSNARPGAPGDTENTETNKYRLEKIQNQANAAPPSTARAKARAERS